MFEVIWILRQLKDAHKRVGMTICWPIAGCARQTLVTMRPPRCMRTRYAVVLETPRPTDFAFVLAYPADSLLALPATTVSALDAAFMRTPHDPPCSVVDAGV